MVLLFAGAVGGCHRGETRRMQKDRQQQLMSVCLPDIGHAAPLWCVRASVCMHACGVHG